MPEDRRDTPEPSPEAPQPGAQEPAGKPPDAKATTAHAGGFTLDLSSGPSAGQPEAWRRQRKQASPILTKIVDLSTPKPAPEPPKPEKPVRAKQEKPEPPRAQKREDGRGRGKKPGGATLADLLDEATLARLRGEG